jgi:hypothetical protein
MTLKDYINNLQRFGAENPETLNLKVIYSKDEEGNEFKPVIYGASKGIFEDRSYISSDELKVFKRKKNEINAVCIN